MRNALGTIVLALLVASAPACATKKFVRTEVGVVDGKITSTTSTLERTQEQTRRNEARIDAVDAKAEAAARAASDASASAAATSNATQAVDTRLTTAVSAVNTRIDASAADLAVVRKLVREVTLTEDNGGFQFGRIALPDTTTSHLDQMVQQLKTDTRLIWIEIEGHTDNVGPTETNERVGLERAEAVKRYLYTQHHIPLHKISVISYGEERPIAPNTTRSGRAQNRRVVIRILS